MHHQHHNLKEQQGKLRGGRGREGGGVNGWKEMKDGRMTEQSRNGEMKREGY